MALTGLSTEIQKGSDFVNVIHLDDAHLRTIRRNGYFLLDIINEILDLSKIEAGMLDVSFERFAPDQLVEDVRKIMEVLAIDNNLTLGRHVSLYRISLQ